MKISIKWIARIAVFSAVLPIACSAHDTQSVLIKYKEGIEQTWAENGKPADTKIRDTLLQQLRTGFTKDIQATSAPDKTISQHFDTFLENIAAANNGFKFKEGPKFREQFIKDAATALVKGLKSASDLNANRTPNGWFETFSGMLQQVRDRLALYKGLGSSVASTLVPTFMDVYRASTINVKSDPADDYKEQLAAVKKLFPTTKPDLKEKNGPFATILEGHANTLFKERTK